MEYHASKMVKRLVDRIEKEFGIKCDPNSFQRTYANSWLKNEGAYSWTLDVVYKTGGLVAGHVAGFDAVSECVKRKNNLEGYNEGFFTFSITIVPEIKTVPYDPTKYEIADEQTAESVNYWLKKGESFVVGENNFIYRCVEKRKYGTNKLYIGKCIPVNDGKDFD